jgi:hypothetical protein
MSNCSICIVQIQIIAYFNNSINKWSAAPNGLQGKSINNNPSDIWSVLHFSFSALVCVQGDCYGLLTDIFDIYKYIIFMNHNQCKQSQTLIFVY